MHLINARSLFGNFHGSHGRCSHLHDSHSSVRRDGNVAWGTIACVSGTGVTMSANPALVRTGVAELVPAPFPGEMFLLRRDGVYLELDGVRTTSGK